MFMSTHPRQVVNRYNFMEILSRAWARGMMPSDTISGFHATGVFPFNKRAITIPDLEEMSVRMTVHFKQESLLVRHQNHVS